MSIPYTDLAILQAAKPTDIIRVVIQFETSGTLTEVMVKAGIIQASINPENYITEGRQRKEEARNIVQAFDMARQETLLHAAETAQHLLTHISKLKKINLRQPTFDELLTLTIPVAKLDIEQVAEAIDFFEATASEGMSVIERLSINVNDLDKPPAYKDKIEYTLLDFSADLTKPDPNALAWLADPKIESKIISIEDLADTARQSLMRSASYVAQLAKK